MNLRMKKLSALGLIELIAAITIIAIVFAGGLLALSTTLGHIYNPTIYSQAINIGHSYLSEILSKKFPSSVPCNGSGHGSRNSFNDVCDYENLVDVGVKDRRGTSISGLQNYTVRVTLNSTNATIGGLATSDVIAINIAVEHANLNQAVVIDGYKTKY